MFEFKCILLYLALKLKFQTGIPRGTANLLYNSLRSHIRSFPSNMDIWDYRDKLMRPQSNKYNNGLDQETYGYGRFILPDQIIPLLLDTAEFVDTMDIDFGRVAHGQWLYCLNVYT